MKILDNNIVCIVQARMTSKRLPNKVMLELAGKPALYHVFNQLSFCKNISKYVLATSIDKTDDILEYWAHLNKISIFRGNLNNVLERYYKAAKLFDADIIVRITADCPLINPKVVDKIISVFLNNNFDYICNNNPPSFPEGLDVEVFSFKVLTIALNNSLKNSEKEHVTPYIINHPEIFNNSNIKCNEDLKSYRLTLDHIEDYFLLYRLFSDLYKPNKFIDLNEIIKYFKKNKNLSKINKDYKRNEGYIISLKNDNK